MSKNAPHKIGDTIYTFDGNRRVYRDDHSSPIYEKHFESYKITGENDKEFICNYGTINKRSGKYKLYESTYKVFTEKMKEDDIYIHENRYRISQLVCTQSAELLRKIDELISK